MSRRALKERKIRNLTKASGGRSYTVTLPIEYVKKLRWRARQKLEISLYGSRIIIKDWKKK